MTPNMIVTLLRIYRGDFNTQSESDARDVNGLLGWKLVEKGPKEYNTTEKGEDYIRRLREVQP